MFFFLCVPSFLLLDALDGVKRDNGAMVEMLSIVEQRKKMTNRNGMKLER